jgi:hypothetical protein
MVKMFIGQAKDKQNFTEILWIYRFLHFLSLRHSLNINRALDGNTHHGNKLDQFTPKKKNR